MKKLFVINYDGNSSFLKRRVKNQNILISADNERQAVEEFYESYFNTNYFPQEDGTVFDCDGNILAEPNDCTFFYDGGYISAEEVEE